MKLPRKLFPCFIVASVLFCLAAATAPKWGFFAHKRINQLAVFTLPPELIVFYKQHIGYITDHATDPDKRRYAVQGEAIRHFIDLDQWGKPPFGHLSRDLEVAVVQEGAMYVISSTNDTLLLYAAWPDSLAESREIKKDASILKAALTIQRKPLNSLMKDVLRMQLGRTWFSLPDSTAFEVFDVSKFRFEVKGFCMKDNFTIHGVVPYILPIMQSRLTNAFRRKDVSQILKYSADIGHYIADAHVPLHTTKNYNGQLTNQVGIHGFWESRIPELFAESDYDFFVGRAQYIQKPLDFYWATIFKSHTYLDSVLLIEKDLSITYPTDKQFCYEERNNQMVRTQCKDYAEAYNTRMNGMVERRFRSSILSVGSIWLTCWVDAGQPDLHDLGIFIPSLAEIKEAEELDAKYKNGNGQGRDHE